MVTERLREQDRLTLNCLARRLYRNRKETNEGSVPQARKTKVIALATPLLPNRTRELTHSDPAGKPPKRAVFAAPPTPNLNSLLARRDREFELATRQATAGERRFPSPERRSIEGSFLTTTLLIANLGSTDFSLQEESFSLVQAAVESLPTGEQQTMLCLMLKYVSESLFPRDNAVSEN